MLLQVQNFRLWMKATMGQRGAALVEYAILLAFVAVVGAAFVGAANDSIAYYAEQIVNRVAALLKLADTNSK